MMKAHDYSEEWKWWFTGFVDGEGCFYIRGASSRQNGYVRYLPLFAINLRDDDSKILEKIQVYIEGKVGFRPEHKNKMSGSISKPQMRAYATNKVSLFNIVRHFDKYSLQSRKARDYAI